MFIFKPKEASELEKVIIKALEELDSYPASSPEYAEIVEQITRLNTVAPPKTAKQVSPDTLAVVIGNLVGILVIVKFERANVLTSKAVGFVLKAVR